jgi:hypothetical protein
MHKRIYFSVTVLTCILFSFLLFGMQKNKNTWFIDIVFQLETEKEKINSDILVCEDAIKKSDITISKSQTIISMAQQKGNKEAEQIAKKAIQKAQDAKAQNARNIQLMKSYYKKLSELLVSLKANPNKAEILSEQFKLDNKQDEWMKEKDKLILERLSVPDPYCLDLEKSLKSNAPPPLSGKKFSDLKPGDVILVKTENLSKQNDSYEQILNVTSTALTNAISITDNLFSGTKEDINHTLIYLKEINGKKIFLDNVPGKGPTIISEDEFSFIYGKREANVAEIARPLTKEQGEKLYSAARQLADQQLQKKYIGSKYGIMGTDLVCSEASRWALVQAGAQFLPETDDKWKKLNVKGFTLGVEWSPADFCKSNYFIVTPLSGIPKSKLKN